MTIRPYVVTVAEAARLLSIGRTKAYDLIRTGDIPSVKIGQTIRVPVDALEKMVRQATVGSVNTAVQGA